MKPADFGYLRPSTIPGAVTALAGAQGEATPRGFVNPWCHPELVEGRAIGPRHQPSVRRENRAVVLSSAKDDCEKG